MSVTTEVVLCGKCKGHGQTSHEECVDYHKREYDMVYKTCINCNGHGRLWKTTSVKFELMGEMVK